MVGEGTIQIKQEDGQRILCICCIQLVLCHRARPQVLQGLAWLLLPLGLAARQRHVAAGNVDRAPRLQLWVLLRSPVGRRGPSTAHCLLAMSLQPRGWPGRPGDNRRSCTLPGLVAVATALGLI